MKISKCHIFHGLGADSEDFIKFHAQNGAKNGNFHANFTLLGAGDGAETVFCDSIMFRLFTLVFYPKDDV